MNIPEKISRIIAGKAYQEDDIGLSGSRVLLFDDYVLKIENSLHADEKDVEMMQWLAGKLPVPQVICCEDDGMNRYLLMSRIKGKMACDTYYLEHPEEMVTLLAEAIRMLWSMDVAGCPRHTNLDAKLAEAKDRVENGLVDVEDTQPTTFGEGGFQDPEELLRWLEDNKPEYEPALSHGDFCLPNIFLEDGKISGFIDLGASGVADKWHDVALCYRSLSNNMNGTYGGKVYENFQPDILFEKLEIEPDWEKIKYYILLDELF